jgi:carbonic anhydrase/acetyltransferase-like protein (isoleucine patch superfamily)
MVALLGPTTVNPPVVLSYPDAPLEYEGWIHATCPDARVIGGPDGLADAFPRFELSDAFLVLDPRSLPVGDFQLSALTSAYAAEPRVALHFVTFEAAIGGTKEKVSLDPTGQVRGIQRHYGHATWPFIAGITASVIPGACGMLTEGLKSRSLSDLRQILSGRGVPSRDVPIEGGALNLAEERGMLSANEMATLKVARQRGGDLTTPILVGSGQSVHPSARFVGPVVLHANVHVEENATLLGPAVIGVGARISARAVVAHTTVAPDSIVPEGRVVRDRVWFGEGSLSAGRAESPVLTYGERLARLAIEPPTHQESQSPELPPVSVFDRRAKRVLDVTAAAISLTILAPLLALIAIAVWLESKGPIFFGDKREGEGGRVFRCWKFRTMFTGYLPTPAIVHPSLGAVLAHEFGTKNNLPAYVGVPSVPAVAGTGYLSSKYGAFELGADPGQRNFQVRDIALPKGMTEERFARRQSAREALEDHFRQAEANPAELDAMGNFYQQAYKLISSAEARKAFSLDGEPDSMTRLYGDYPRRSIGRQLMLARRLVEAGVRLVTVMYSGAQGWDNHTRIKDAVSEGLPAFDHAFSGLIADLDQRGLLDSTLVMVTSEFGRTPKMNENGGRDHWARVYSQVLAGGGITRGQIYGASNATAAEPDRDPVTVENFLATVYHQLGVDCGDRLIAPGNRPIDIVRDGKFVEGLCAA